MNGSVRDEENNFLFDVRVSIDNVFTKTDANGRFLIEIPPEKQKSKQTLIAYKDNYLIWEANVYPATQQEVKIIGSWGEICESANRACLKPCSIQAIGVMKIHGPHDWPHEPKLLAVITYGWEKRQYYINWMGDNDPIVIDSLIGLGLNLASPQSKFAQALLRKIDFVLKSDINYVKRLKKHYKIFKTEIDKQNKKVPLISKPTVGRNDPCPCRSGKKFKKCCLK